MPAPTKTTARPRAALSKDRVLDAAVRLADRDGVDALSMRKIAQTLDVVPMALYKHVANKDELLDGIVDVLVSEIDPPGDGGDWQPTMRQRILSARTVLLHHPWGASVLEARSKARRDPTPVMMEYLDSMVGIFRNGGFSVDLAHHAMHVMGSRIMGFSQELFEDNSDARPEPDAAAPEELARRYPHLAEIVTEIAHDDESVVGAGCDDQAEFEFALDLVLDGLERLRAKESAAS